MKRLRCSIAVLMLWFATTHSYAQIGQIGSVISIASKYATLLQTNKNDVVYADENLDEKLENHSKIAIIPFNSHISYVKPPEVTEESALEQFENQQMIGKMLQEQFWDVFDNNVSEVELQDIRITNKVLNDIGYFTRPAEFPPSYLAQLLQVDAVLLCTYDIHIDNERTGWQNLSKAVGELAMSQLKGAIPVGNALSFVKNPKAIIDIATKPGEFFNKLKKGDITALATIAGSMLPEGNWSKIATIAAKNSNTIQKVAKGDMSNLFSDLIANNASMLSSELKINPQVVKLVQNNAKSVQNVLTGNTEGLMMDLISNNVSSIANKYVGDQNNALAKALTNNSTIIAKLATGDTSNLLQDVINKNIGEIAGVAGAGKSQMFTEIITKNSNIVGKVISGDFENLASDLLQNNASILGETLPPDVAQKFGGILSNKDAIKGLLSGDTNSILETLTNQGVEMFGDQIKGVDLAKFSKLVGENKDLLQSVVSGDKEKLLSSLLQKDNALLGKALDNEEITKFASLVGSKGDIIKTALSGDPKEALGGWLKGMNLGENINSDEINKLSEVILNNKEALPSIMKGDKNQIMSLVGNISGANTEKIVDELLKNKTKFNRLVGVEENKNFGILGKTPEELEVLAFQLANKKEVLGGILKGNASEIQSGFTQKEIQEELDIDPDLLAGISESLVSEKKNISQLMVNSKINTMLLNDQIDIQFFDFGDDALLEDYENVRLKKKTVSQTAASILDPTTDPKDYTRLSINIFGKDSNEILWQYIYEDNKTRLYDMGKTLPKVVNRVNKNFPYFITKESLKNKKNN